ncbi:hypothetical protein FHG87_025305 [Trinorchestia longiramus]|nr:hypothetical protein FHG87_025305 [Trinorchestia longiramus]
MPKRRHKEGKGSVSCSGGESEAWPPLEVSSRPPSTSPTASYVEEEGLLRERNLLDLEAATMTSEIIQPEIISSTKRNYSFYWKNQFEIPNFEGFNESFHMSSEEDNPITPRQRPREVNRNNATLMQPTMVLVQPVDNPTNESFLSNEIKLVKALAASTFMNCGKWENMGEQEHWTAALQQPELQGMDDLQRESINFTNNLIKASHKVFKKQKDIPFLCIIGLGGTQNVLRQ